MIIFQDVEPETYRGKEIESSGKRMVKLIQTAIGWAGKEMRWEIGLQIGPKRRVKAHKVF